VREMLKNGCSEVVYPWNHPKLGKIYVRCGGVPDKIFEKTGASLNGYHQDITETMVTRKKQEQSIMELLERVRQANSAKSEFLSHMSHDLRTPINGILGMLAILEKSQDDPKRQSECRKKIRVSAEHLLSLVNDVLQVSKLESGRPAAVEEPFDLHGAVEDCIAVLSPLAEERGIRLELEKSGLRHGRVIGNPLHLRQILINVIDNALKYNRPHGSVFVRAEEAAFRDGTASCRFVIEDTGIGIGEDFKEHIFEPFTQEHQDAMTQYNGAGLGMSIVKNLVDRMQGEITVKSEEGIGSCFTVELPFSIAPRNQKPSALPHNASVLIAASRTPQTELMAAYLQDGGLLPIHMESGLKAVTWLTEAQYENRMPCAMLLGQMLDDMPVLDLAAHIRQLTGREFPILLVSEEDWAQLAYRATKAGVSAFAPCPLFKSKLLSTLADLTHSSRNDDGSCRNRSRDLGSYRLLLVEDIELNQEIVIELLSVTGIQVEVADNGADAVKKFQDSPEGYYDLIFMDIQMPVMNGYEAAEQIRQLDRADAAKVWIVAMTANAFVEDVRLAREAGMNEHISKPVDPDCLQEIVYRQLT